jgi:putative hydrolase of the HAD superfamily
MSTIEAVLFDFGGVFTLSPFTAIDAAALQRGLDPAVVTAVIFGDYGQDGDHPWHRLERGDVALIDAMAELAVLAEAEGITDDALSFLAGLAADDLLRAEVVERALAVRAGGRRTALVTNNVLEFGDGWRRMVPVDDLFDVVIDSCQVRMRKPNPAIFRAALDAVDCPPERAAFLDDHPAHVAAASALGIHSILVGPDRLAAFDELDELLRL